jgi:hypothetical protein
MAWLLEQKGSGKGISLSADRPRETLVSPSFIEKSSPFFGYMYSLGMALSNDYNLWMKKNSSKTMCCLSSSESLARFSGSFYGKSE